MFLWNYVVNNITRSLSNQASRRAGQRCFWLLALISSSQIRYIHLSERMILSGSLIPSDNCILKNLIFMVRIHSRGYVTALVKSLTWPGWRTIIKKAMSFLAFRPGSQKMAWRKVPTSRKYPPDLHTTLFRAEIDLLILSSGSGQVRTAGVGYG